MRVTNEQIRAEIICTQGDTCEGCPFYGVDNCDNLRGNDFDMYKDLLEARELIKEMIEYIHDTVDYTDSCYCPSCARTHTILEKTKEYAE